MQDTQTPPIPPPPSAGPRRRSRWWIPVAVIGGLLVLFIVVIGAFVGALFSGFSEIGGGLDKEAVQVKDKSVLVVDLSSGVVEHRPNLVFNFGGDQAGVSLMSTIHAIRDAKDDPKIEGIYYRAGGGVGMTKLTEIREALIDFKSSGKFVYAFLESGSKQHYYMATVADSIFMPQEGILEFNAFGASGMFFKGLSDKLGIEWHVEQFEEYKSAAEMMSRENWSEPAKQEVRELIEHRQNMFVDAVASGRKLDKGLVLAAMNRGVYLPDSLKALGLIDGFSRESELRERIARRIDPSDTSDHPKLNVVSVSAYADRENSADMSEVQKDKGIAIVFASGAIASGKNSDPFDQGGIYSRDLIAQLRKAAKNEDVDAILIRIDSPGGSAIASDEIWAVIKEIRQTKPVYASMSDVAASGGYYIAMACDTIIAHPSTITGSIGVIMAIPNLSGTMDKLGIGRDTISLGASSNFMNTTMKFTDADKAKLREFGAGIYQRFVQKVADSRKKSFEDTRALAKGRVWSGTAAKQAGLVDINGGLLDAIKIVKRRIGADENKKVMVYSYPEKIDNLSAILKMFGIDDSNGDDEEASAPRVTIPMLLERAMGSPSAVEQAVKAMPADARRQFEHAAALANIGLTERAMIMMPMLVPNE